MNKMKESTVPILKDIPLKDGCFYCNKCDKIVATFEPYYFFPIEDFNVDITCKECVVLEVQKELENVKY